MLIILLLINNFITETQLIDFFVKVKIFYRRKNYLKSILILLGQQEFLNNIIFKVIIKSAFVQLGVINKRHLTELIVQYIVLVIGLVIKSFK